MANYLKFQERKNMENGTRDQANCMLKGGYGNGTSPIGGQEPAAAFLLASGSLF
ncbi:hypothetical protein [Negadavirga shengliensis]|uniref:Uncharacterized protein n=1 Tax=Negadavirga shengliensis TaxID=1389218 RepID=A0ABV9T438_9BACT